LIPTNLYGPGDNFDLQDSHVIPALIRKFHEAKVNGEKTVIVWGSGTPRREFLFVDDLADACLFLMECYHEDEMINVGVGTDQTIEELAQVIGEVVGFTGKLAFDLNQPDGTPRKLLEVTRLSRLGWRARTSLREGLENTYSWFLGSHWAKKSSQ